ncbi:MAG: hypothetical protein U0894_06910 [Pirellulales bacterium]
MESTPASHNPYQVAPSEEFVKAQATSPQKYTWKTTLAVIVLVLGTIGFANGCFSMLGTVFGSQLQKIFTSTNAPGGGAAAQEMDNIMRRYQQDILAIHEENRISLVIFAILHIVSGALLFAGGLSVLSSYTHGNPLLRNACLFAIVFEVGRVILTTYVAFETKTVMARFATDIAQANGGNMPADSQNMIKTMMLVSFYVGLAIQILLVITRTTFYAITAAYFGRIIKAEKLEAEQAASLS